VWNIWSGYKKDCKYVKNELDVLRKYSRGEATPPPRFDEDPPYAVYMYSAVFDCLYKAPLWPVYLPYKLYDNNMNSELRKAWMKQYYG
jgi:hypothetical protein